MKQMEILLNFLSYDGTLTNDPVDAIKIKNRIQDTNLLGVIRYQKSIPTATVDTSIELPDAASEYLLIFIDREVTIKLNGSSDAITLKPRANGTKTFAFYTKGTISALSLSNQSGEAVNLDVISINK